MVDQKVAAIHKRNTWAGAAGDGESHTCNGTPQMQPEHAKLYQSTPTFPYTYMLMPHASQSMACAFARRESRSGTAAALNSRGS